MKPLFRLSIALVVLLTLSSVVWLTVREDRVDFNTQIKPLLNKNCIACHGGVKKASNFSLLFEREALAAAKSGKHAIVPGNANASELIRRLTLTDPDERMPLEAPPLKKEEIELLRDWIDQGAEWGNHWAYQPVEKPEVPEIGTFWSRLGLVENDEVKWAKNEIDHFVLNKVSQDKEFAPVLKPSPEADRATLIRRVSLDLTGLPPTEQEVTDFLKDTSPDAYEKMVDRTLRSPAYGERWTGMWLDLARYADTKGYEADLARPMWRYRDWLIKAFNQDKPFDQFTIEQLAGDLLTDPNGKTDNNESLIDNPLIATAFHRNTMTNDEGGTQDEEFRVAAVLDRVNTTWDVWQGTTFGCVQCHSHPYDPFTHEEYYKYLAFFNNTRDEDVPSDTPTLRFYKEADSVKVQELNAWVSQHATNPQQVKTANRFTRLTEPKVNSHSFDQYVKASLMGAMYTAIQDGGSARIKNMDLNGKNRLILAWGTKAENAVMTIRQDSVNGPVLTQQPVPKTGSPWRDTTLVFALPKVSGRHHLFLTLNSPKNPKEWVMVKWVSVQPALPGQPETALGEMDHKLTEILNAKAELVPVMQEGVGDQVRETFVFERGNWLVKGKKVRADVPKSLPPMPADLPRNRLGLARWMVSRQHPLTARVAVNRFWEQLFGTGIVETVEDIGTQGIPPSHRELLDWLAVEFMETDHWSVKKLLRRIVLSATYRQRSSVSPEALALDPWNKMLMRGPRVRLTAEQVRDQALATTGLLSKKQFGPSVMPIQPDGIWQSPYSPESWKLSQGEDRYRRALYTYWKRTAPYPSMITFDSPSREFCQLRRLRTNTPLQALVTLNDPVYVEAAQHLADWMRYQGKTPEQQIQAGFQRIMLRPLSPAKLAVLTQLYRTTKTHYQQQPEEARKLLACTDGTPELAALAVTANTMLNLDEVVTKE
ncbi:MULTISPECIES: DUF1553 domain-containing protein [Larkinella]|uniref:DUF1553 domain-containing protein n=1 Tax=Larkinella punicea TaxID=2315727 RepID=A0A368JKI6_9BACT|nr:DUF1553 domain-containing protein [Larkinella punicea]RCR68160.1 DUF1553 domain-containing protein [Larkinella punicea]